MAGELIPKPQNEIEPWRETNTLGPRAPEFPPMNLGGHVATNAGGVTPPVQNIYFIETHKSEALNQITADLSRPVVMLIWGAVLVGLFLTGWWRLAADFGKVGVVLFAVLFATAPHARKYLLLIAAGLLGLAVIASLMWPEPVQPVLAPVQTAAPAPTGKHLSRPKAKPATKNREDADQ